MLRATTTLTRDTRVWALRPDVPPDIASIEVSARSTDGATLILLLVKNPAIEWPTPYIMKAPRLLRRGTEISVFAQRRTAGGDVPAGRLRMTLSRY
jgi:hypothetical protein